MYTIQHGSSGKRYGNFKTVKAAEKVLEDFGYAPIGICHLWGRPRGEFVDHVCGIVPSESLPISELPTYKKSTKAKRNGK